jgi:hypothetical protein
MEEPRTIPSGSEFGSSGAYGVRAGRIFEARITKLFPCHIFQRVLRTIDPYNHYVVENLEAWELQSPELL